MLGADITALECLSEVDEEMGRVLRIKTNERMRNVNGLRRGLTRLKLSCLFTLSGPDFYLMMDHLGRSGDIIERDQLYEKGGAELSRKIYQITSVGREILEIYHEG